ncbi:hypothetical protein GCM10007103_05130 [Salinimicrobium marinum]|uniref:DUF3857 domain-containing protein n=1 Tax=Salinimicrobium marinum TaxID=680283 RepID=A0A918S8P9_9FLAO|nr:DUF3857 domain-containing protein [Salinimicrobium marinum]GHA26723.1 hypothetical protein GCM10007103_05130 [Salinimicrobium marinum]
MRTIYLCCVLLLTCTFLQAQNFKFGKVSEEEVLEKSHPKDPEANAAILFREHNTYYELNRMTGFVLVTKIHERVKIYNKDGFDYATKEVTYYKNGNDREKMSGAKGVTYNIVSGELVEEKLNKDGIFDEEVSDYQLKTKLTMPAVKEGSVIEYEYSIRSPFLTSIDIVPLQSMIPINKLEAQVTIPEFFNFKKHMNLKSGLYFPIEESRKSDVFWVDGSSNVNFTQNKYAISAVDIPALKEEAYIDYLQNYAAFLKWELQYTKFPNSVIENYSQTWEGVAKSIYDDGGYSKEFGRSSYYKNDVDALLSGVIDPLEKAALIYNLVREKVKWNEYLGFLTEDGCRSAYKDGEGNVGEINLMLTSMLKYAGLNASPVLVSTQSNGIPVFPTRSGFNYVISGIEMADQIVLLDATDKTTAMGELPRRARNWQGRIIRENGSSAWIDLMPHYTSDRNSTLNVMLGEDLILKGKVLNKFTGLDAKDYRDNFAGINLDQHLEQLELNKGNIAISNLETLNEDFPGKEIEEKYEFELQDGLESINGKMYLKPLLFLALEENPFKADERQYPVIFDYPLSRNNTVNIMVPEGYQVESIPESIISDFNNGAGTFKFIASQNGQFLRVQAILEVKTIAYSNKEYKALKDFYALMVEKQTEPIVFSKM